MTDTKKQDAKKTLPIPYKLPSKISTKGPVYSPTPEAKVTCTALSGFMFNGEHVTKGAKLTLKQSEYFVLNAASRVSKAVPVTLTEKVVNALTPKK